MENTFERMVGMMRDRYTAASGSEAVGFAVQMAGRAPVPIGRSEPVATLVVNDPAGLAALCSLDAVAIGEAYLRGALDVNGDLRHLLSLRELFADRHPLRYALRFVRPLLAGQPASDRGFIAQHYNEDPDFYLLFLDSRHRCYSQAVFASDDEPLETAMTRKLDFALESIGVGPGARVLDIGGGWGAFTEYGGKKGIHVTSLTISEPSRRFIQEMIDREKLPCRVLLEHLYEHRAAEPYDAIVNLGVTEHLPDYARSLAAYRALLRPGGKVYLDASACRTKHDVSTFFERHIFRGNGSPLCLHDYLTALSRTPFEVEQVLNDRHNYYLTTLHWAQGLDRHREQIEQRWGRAWHRKFQIYLWGCVDGFSRDIIQAYRLVLRLPEFVKA